jgi:probable HAF family extracellular repeat protein
MPGKLSWLFRALCAAVMCVFGIGGVDAGSSAVIPADGPGTGPAVGHQQRQAGRGNSFNGGKSWYDNEATHWQDGTRTLLGSFGLLSCAYAINDKGQIVSCSRGSDGKDHAVMGSGEAIVNLGLLGGNQAEASNING